MEADMSKRSAAEIALQFHSVVTDRLRDAFPGIPAFVAEILKLHGPDMTDGRRPACLGCDRMPGVETAPWWPCSTYTIIACAALGLPSRREVKPRIVTLFGEYAEALTT
jgi:hypothetical protein